MPKCNTILDAPPEVISRYYRGKLVRKLLLYTRNLKKISKSDVEGDLALDVASCLSSEPE